VPPSTTHVYALAVTMTRQRQGAQSMTAPLVEALVKRPGPAFGRAFDDPAHGYLHPVDLELARRQHGVRRQRQRA
jgi:hypothetical protein